MTSRWDPVAREKLWELVGRVARPPSLCAWALEETGQDAEAAAILIVPDELLSRLEQNLARILDNGSAHLEPHVRARIVDVESLLARRGAPPTLPDDPRGWARAREGLDRDNDPRLRLARRLGRRGTVVGTAVPRVPGRDPIELLDGCALATDLFPIREFWRPITRTHAIDWLADATGRGLAYRREPETMRGYVARATRFLDLFAAEAAVFAGEGLTTRTFDRGIGAVDQARVGVACLGEED